MSSLTLPANTQDHPHVRPLNILRDLPQVADLIELCFAPTMDNDGQRYLSDMRRASTDTGFLRWAARVTETTSLPLTGYVWEQDGRIVGNASLIPFRDHGQRVHLIANVAVHPDYRRRGIAFVLTQRAMQHARERSTTAIWLHVRDDNPAAIGIYAKLGFQEIARRTTWYANTASYPPLLNPEITVTHRPSRLWPLQQDWLRRLYPETLYWYNNWNFASLRPGLLSWLYRIFVDSGLQQWSALQGDDPLAVITWLPQGARPDALFAAVPEAQSPEHQVRIAAALTKVLTQARRALSSHARLSLEYPADEMNDAISLAGFKRYRTLIWMRAPAQP